MADMGQNEPCQSLRRHGRTTSVSGPAGPAAGAALGATCVRNGQCDPLEMPPLLPDRRALIPWAKWSLLW